MPTQPTTVHGEWGAESWPCRKDLSKRHAQVLALECAGHDHDEIGSLLSITKSTVDKEASAAHQRVVPAHYVATRDRAMAWGWLHNVCCLAPEWLTAGLPLMGRLKSG